MDGASLFPGPMGADGCDGCPGQSCRSVGKTFVVSLGTRCRLAVVPVLDGLTKKGKAATASRTAAYGRACYQWATKRGSLAANPFQNLPLAPVARRGRVLSDDELRSVWDATADPGSFNAIVRTLMVTGQRREEVTAMTWDKIAPDLSTWTIPATPVEERGCSPRTAFAAGARG